MSTTDPVQLPTRWCTHPDCGRPILESHAWRLLPDTARRRLRHLGRRAHAGRGLCTVCHDRAKRAGELDTFPRLIADPSDRVPVEVVAEEWEHLTAGRTETSRIELVREVAPRLGMTEDALERALDRMGAAA